MDKKKESQKKLEPPPHLEAVPLYDIIPPIAYKAVDTDRRNAPQLKGDFLVFYIRGIAGRRRPYPIYLLDVKKSRSTYKKKEGKNSANACLMHGLIAAIVYPIKEYDKVYSLNDWSMKLICPSCGELSDDVMKCTSCGILMYPFTREDWKYFEGLTDFITLLIRES